MSEQNILNPTSSSQLNPQYPLPMDDPQIISRWQAKSGKPFARYMFARGMVMQLHWEKVPFTTYYALRQWFNQYERDFFTYADFDSNRYYSGQFMDQPHYEVVGNNQVSISANFVVIPGLPLFQYPSNWGVDSIFYEERDGFGQDLVKLTGTWDRQDKNYLLFSEQFNTAPWAGETNVTVTPNNQTDPLGGNTADTIATGVTAAQGIVQISAMNARTGFQVTFSVWLKAAANTNATIVVDRTGAADVASQAIVVTNAWQRFSITHNATWTGTNAVRAIIRITNAASSIFAWGAQLEFGTAATTYTQTTAAVAVLLAPGADANQHGGYAYFNVGTLTTDAGEWKYFGYGFRLWAYKGPDMGIVQVFLDGVSQGTIDLYAAAATAAAVVLTVQNVVLGDHRIKLSPTNTKNGASANFYVSADAIEVMR
jgi:hypothetical protein